MAIDPQVPLPLTPSGLIEGIDIATNFDDNDFISIALPNFALYSIDQTTSFVDFTSNANGDPAGGPTASIPFSASTIPLVNGDSELRFKRALVNVNSVDLTSITGIRFRVNAITACTFRAMAIRCVSKNWVFAPVDPDTLYRRVGRPVPPNGALNVASAFPTTSQVGLPTDWPIIYKASDPPGVADPTPIDMSVSAWLHSGSLTAASGDADLGVRFTQPGEITVGDIAALRYTTQLTLETWAKPTSLTGDTMYGLFTKFRNTNGQRGYRLGITPLGELRFEFSVDGTATTAVQTTGAAITTNTWQHIAVTYKGGATNPGLPLLLNAQAGQVIFYKNGNMVGQFSGLPTSIFVAPQPFKIGAWDSAQ